MQVTCTMADSCKHLGHLGSKMIHQPREHSPSLLVHKSLFHVTLERDPKYFICICRIWELKIENELYSYVALRIVRIHIVLEYNSINIPPHNYVVNKI